MKTSLRTKIVLMLILSAILLSSVAGYISRTVINNVVDSMYKQRGNELSATIARAVDLDNVRALRDDVMSVYYSSEEKVRSDEWGSDEFYAYLENYSGIKETNEYKQLLKQLRALQEVNSVDCIYIVEVSAEGDFVYMIDAALEDACEPGVIDPIYEMNEEVISHRKVGFPAYITDTEEYGLAIPKYLKELPMQLLTT